MGCTNDYELTFERDAKGKVALKGNLPTRARMSWQFVQYSDPDLVWFQGREVCFLGQVTYKIISIDSDWGYINMRLIQDLR